MRTALLIADCDCSGGAGIQVILKTMTMSTIAANLAKGYCFAESERRYKDISGATDMMYDFRRFMSL